MRRASLIAAIGLAALVTACEEPAAPERPAAVAPQGERLTLKLEPVADLKPAAAVVTTRDMGGARARIGGTLADLRVREGDVVRKGQVIATVRDQRLVLEARAYDAQVAAAEAEAVRAEADLARVRTLHDKGFYATARLEQAQAAAHAARAQADAARAQSAASAEHVDQGVILAPASGRVLRADVPAGSVVAPGQVVATITAGEPLLRLNLPEGQAAALSVGDTVQIDTADLPGAGRGVIAQVYPAVEAGQVTADITTPGLRADLVGRRVGVRVSLGERQGLTAPRRFVATRYGLDFVRVLAADGAAHEVAVQVVPLPSGDAVEILSGVKAGDVLVAMEPAR
ncbi:MAG: efflux RND transporter periplasmic adaptor subunit [Caulobacteraceae bacterium]|nr:efflux RND transporter periplasmic adaptor subunit [Caulobacteraceae bacterium]